MDHASLTPDEWYELLMRGTVLFIPVEAAERLVFAAPGLRRWLIENRFMRVHEDAAEPYAATHFDEAMDRILELSRDGRQFAECGPGKSERAVLYVAAALSGQVAVGTLRHFMSDLEPEHARLVAEAMLYAAGYMDGTADPSGNDVSGPGTGPNALAYERRLEES